MQKLRNRAIQALPIILLLALTTVGLANALQDDDVEVDLGPQPGDFLDADGEVDIAGYLIAAAAFDSAPAIPAGEALELRVFGCVEGDPILIEFVPRGLLADEQAANDELADDDEGRFLEENVTLVEDVALAEPATYEVTAPDGAPVGFARFRVTCTGAEGEQVTDTTVNLVERDAFEAEQEDAEEPAELVTIIDNGAPA